MEFMAVEQRTTVYDMTRFLKNYRESSHVPLSLQCTLFFGYVFGQAARRIDPYDVSSGNHRSATALLPGRLVVKLWLGKHGALFLPNAKQWIAL